MGPYGLSALLIVLAACGGSPGHSAKSEKSGPARDFDASVAAYEKGVSKLSSRQEQEAVAHFQTAVELDPRNHAAWFQLGVLRERRGHWKAALKPLSQAAALGADSPAYAHHHGRSLLEVGRFLEARRELERSLKLSGGQYRTHYFLGRAYERLGLYDEAAAAWTEAARLEPCFTPPFERLAELYELWGFQQRALVVAARGVECDKPSRPPWRLYGVCGRLSEALRENEAALRCYTQALSLQRDADLLFRRGLLHRRLGYDDLAEKDLREYLSNEGRSSWNAAIARRVLGSIGR